MAKGKSPKKKPVDGRLQIEILIDDYKERMGLKDWNIIYLVLEEPSKDAEADIQVAHGRTAYLRLNKSFFGKEPKVQRNILCHELVHVHLFGIDDCFLATKESLGGTGYAILDNLYTEASENVVENLSHLLEPILPLPNWS